MEFWHLEQKKKKKHNHFIAFSLLISCFNAMHILAQMPVNATGVQNSSDPVSRPAAIQEVQIHTDSLQTIPDFKGSRRSDRVGEKPILLPFGQYMQELEANNKNISAGKDFTVGFYLYTVHENDPSLPVKDLISLAARFSIPYEEIALLNDLTANDELVGRTLVIPNASGIFVPLNPKNPLDTLIKKRLYNPNGGNIYIIDGKPFQYHPAERITPTERAFFLDPDLRMPLDNSVLTSLFGKRTSPITGREHLHQGIDLAAPEGTNVYACQAGTVSIATYDDIFGNYIIIQHKNSLQSVYAHLSSMEVETGDAVLKGGIIGRVGSTGASTGPHLHFEIRKNGKAQDPKNFLPAI